MTEVRVYSDEDALAEAVAQHFVTLAVEALSQKVPFTVALAGGSTPRPAYEALATPRYAQRVDWAQVELFWGDERSLPPDHPESNYRLAYEALLRHLPIPEEQVHRMRGELAPERAAELYEQELRSVFGEGRVPRFDLILLGLGEDGHTASLFPGTAVLQEQQHRQQRWVIAHHVEKLDAWRLTLTPVVLNAAENVAFIVAGERKATILERVAQGPYRPQELPAQLVQPRRGRLRWFVDQAALGE
ncbi:MAG: 6-phosphogluconolactonase [Anaerolineales bacterium]